jgi:DNA-binding NarL/FixJ family response regulator
MIRVMVADDHNLVRQGIRALLEKQPGIEVVWEARDGQEALDYCIQIEPDVLVLDINMPRLNGIEVIRRLSEAQVSTRVVILSMYSDESLVKRALQNGAQGYLLKKSITEDLLAAIQAAKRGEKFLSPELAYLLEAGLAQDNAAVEEDVFDRLSAREREVCQLVARGLTNQAIAASLGISVKTVEKHRANLMVKLGVQDVASLIRESIRHGIVFLDE